MARESSAIAVVRGGAEVAITAVSAALSAKIAAVAILLLQGLGFFEREDGS